MGEHLRTVATFISCATTPLSRSLSPCKHTLLAWFNLPRFTRHKWNAPHGRILYAEICICIHQADLRQNAQSSLCGCWRREARKGGGVVLLHCLCGTNRSAALATAYLMAVDGPGVAGRPLPLIVRLTALIHSFTSLIRRRQRVVCWAPCTSVSPAHCKNACCVAGGRVAHFPATACHPDQRAFPAPSRLPRADAPPTR
eukprot:SAG11_NODE_5395_length_1573_cov_1.776798_1_plen_199_part_00